MLDALVPGKRQLERKTENTWKDSCKSDIHGSVTGVKGDGPILVRAKWKNDIRNHSGDPGRWEKPEEKKNTENS